MEEQNNNRSKWLHLRLQPQEYDQIHRYFRQTTCLKISGYARKILLQKPVTTTYRNQSLDELMGELTVLRKELNSLAVNFNQAVKNLHTLSQIPEFRSWLLTWEQEKIRLEQRVGEINSKIDKIADVWLQ